MGLMVHSLARLPLNAERDYFIYLLDYGWKEPIADTLRQNFQRMARLASENKSVVLMGFEGSHFNDEVLSWHRVNGQPGEEMLPALLITTRHPHQFRDVYLREPDDDVKGEFADRMLLIPLHKVCESPTDVMLLIEKIFRDIKERKALADFEVSRELKKGKQGAFVDALILEPNIAGVGLNLNYIVNFLLGRKS
jgi:hypothetical protein